MAWNNEFPHFENNKQVLDWILKQYSTFNQRIQEIQDHFDEVAQGMAEQVAELEQDFTEFTQTVNNNFSQLSHDMEIQVQREVAEIQRQINIISQNMAEYVDAHMSEWQQQAIEILFESDDRNFDTNSTITCEKNYGEVWDAIDNPDYQFKLSYNQGTTLDNILLTNIERFGAKTSSTGYIIMEGVRGDYTYTVRYSYSGTIACTTPELIHPTISNQYSAVALSVSDLDNDGNISGETGLILSKGTYLVTCEITVETPSDSNATNINFELISESNIDDLIKIRDTFADIHRTQYRSLTGLYKSNDTTTNNKLKCNIRIDSDTPTATNFNSLTVKMRSIKIN